MLSQEDIVLKEVKNTHTYKVTHTHTHTYTNSYTQSYMLLFFYFSECTSCSTPVILSVVLTFILTAVISVIMSSLVTFLCTKTYYSKSRELNIQSEPVEQVPMYEVVENIPSKPQTTNMSLTTNPAYGPVQH